MTRVLALLPTTVRFKSPWRTRGSANETRAAPDIPKQTALSGHPSASLFASVRIRQCVSLCLC